MKNQSLNLESLNSSKFSPLSSNAMQSVRGGGDEYPSQGATATIGGKQVPFDHDTTCVVDGKVVTQYLDKNDRLLANVVNNKGAIIK